MDGMAHNKAEDSGHPDLTSHDIDQMNDAGDSESLYGRVAWPVAERMLQMLASNKAPPGFKPANFVKETFEDTFARHVTSSGAESINQRENNSKIFRSSGYSVVDAALGAMGYNATTVYDRKIDILVNILTSVVQSKVSCGSYSLSPTYPPWAFEGTSQGDDMLDGRLCEQRMSIKDLLQMVENCSPFLVSGKAKGTQVLEVVDALVRVAVNTSLFTPCSEASGALYRKVVCANEYQSRKGPARALQTLVDYALDEKEIIYSKLQPCSRLCFWRLRPPCLKQDLSCLAREAMERLLLPINRKLYENEEWASLVVCFALAPDVFVEARYLLHTWFMSSGAIRLWELRAEMVAAVWDVLNRPSVWGFVEEIYLPPQHAFYRTTLRPFILILRWDPTVSGLVKLVSLLDHAENVEAASADCTPNSARSFANKDVEDVSSNSDRVNHNSVWALLMDFLPWLQFASRLLFRRQGCQQNPSLDSLKEDLEGATFHIEGVPRETCTQVAARYIAWIMNPLDSSLQRADEKMLLHLSNSWDKVIEALCVDSSPAIRGGEDPSLLQSAGQPKSLNCGRCGASIRQLKRLKCEVTGESFGKGNDERVVSQQRLSMAALDLWLADLQGKLNHRGFVESEKHVEKEADGNVDGVVLSKDANPSLSNIDRKQKVVMMSLLPLGALAESLLLCSRDFMARLLQFVGYGGNQVPSDQKDYTCQDQGRLPDIPACNSGCSRDHCEDCCPTGSAKSARFKGNQVQGVDGSTNDAPLEFQDGKSSDWIPGAAAMFNFLDSMFDDESFWPATVHSESGTSGAKSEVYKNLAVIISEFAKEWGSTFETQSSTGVFLKGPKKECFVLTLEDIRSRFCAWMGKLPLSPEVVRICDDAREALDMRIANLRSLLISS